MKKPNAIVGLRKAPKEPATSMGDIYLTIIGVRVLKKPTQNPWMSLPMRRAVMDFIRINKPPIIARILTFI